MTEVDAVVIGSGPNGMAAAVILARAGLRVSVYERNATIGGGARTVASTLPGFVHDVGSAVHPMALASPFFRAFGIADRIEFRVPEASYAHPLDGGRAVVAWRDIDRTSAALGLDGEAWRSLVGPLAARPGAVSEVTGGALVSVPRHPLLLVALGLRALEQGSSALWGGRFRNVEAEALFTGVMAHANRRLPGLGAAAAGLVLATHGHAAGWPIPVGGSGAIIAALAADLVAHGGTITPDVEVDALEQLPAARAYLFDTTPEAMVRIVGSAMPEGYARAARRFRFGNGVAKVDFALSAPVPWANDELAATGTLHVGGTRAEMVAGERDVSRGKLPESPYVLVSQPSLFDPSRAPGGQHVLWAYTHVPAGYSEDRQEAIIRQIERFAPGFRDTILATASTTAVDVASSNPNLVGGDIGAGDVAFPNLLRRPVLFDPWSTPARGVYLCSASAAPGPGVHGQGGLNAARRVLAREFGVATLPSLAP